MSYRLGLTGSIGTGKSTTAAFFAEEGCAVWDADAAVHRLYGKDGAAVAPMAAAFPGAVRDGAVDRVALRRIIAADPGALKRIEAIVHPLVRQDRAGFAPDAAIIVYDIPLLYETGAEQEMDSVVCVLAPPEVQQQRVLARGTMTLEEFHQIRDAQLSAEEKCARADHVVVTDTLEHARAQVRRILHDIRKAVADARDRS